MMITFLTSIIQDVLKVPGTRQVSMVDIKYGQVIWIQILALLFIFCMTLGNYLTSLCLIYEISPI